jgi:hypothetical protein
VTKPYYLIDFENVQPKALDRLQPGTTRIKVFLGQHQTKLVLDVVQALQRFGPDAEYIQIQGNGPDAVDFHIAFYIGRIAVGEPDATFNIISKDTGFDPLVRHLNGLGIACRRLPEIPPAVAAAAATTVALKTTSSTAMVPAKVPAKAATKQVAKKVVKKVAQKKPKNMTVTVLPEPNGPAPAPKVKAVPAHPRVPEVVTLLKKSTKPTRLESLKSSIKSWLGPALDEKAVNAIVQGLQDSKKISVDGTKVV